MSDLGLTLEGGATSGYYFSPSVYNNTSGTTTFNTSIFNDNKDNLALSDFLLEVRSKKMDFLKSEIRFGVGNMKAISILDGNANHALNTLYQAPTSLTTNVGTAGVSSQTVDQKIGLDDQFDVNLYYGQISLSPTKDAYVEVGRLATNLGYEVSPTYANWNNLLGLVWTKQPTYYPGARIRYQVNEANVYAEYSQDSMLDGEQAWALGVYGTYAMVRYSASYFDTNSGGNIADIMFEVDLPQVIVALNFDYHLRDTTPIGGTDRDAYAVAVYAIPYFQKYYFPIRFEYVYEGDSRVFGVDRAYSVTLSPTINLSDYAFVRIEGAYVSSFNEVFRQLDDNSTLFAKWSMNAQVGYYF